MTRRILSAVALVALIGVPLWGAAPFGEVTDPAGSGNGLGGVATFRGWALDDDGVAEIRVFVDGIYAGKAVYGLPYPGSTYPGYPDSPSPAFEFGLQTNHYLNGDHTVELYAVSDTGEMTRLSSKRYLFTNTTHTLAPFGEIESPVNAERLYGTCDLTAPIRTLTDVTGWVLDAGVETGDMGIGYVELLIDGALWYNDNLSCYYDPDTGELTNCYGLPRPDIERIFPDLRDSAHSGYRFLLDIGALLATDTLVPGQHVLTIRSGDIAGQIANVDEVPVTFNCEENVQSGRDLLLNDERFEVEVDFAAPNGWTGYGFGVPETDDSGFFWFFNPQNIELVVKVLDHCVDSDRFWFFAAGLTNVEVDIRVTDTETNTVRTYHNPQGRTFETITDTNAFATCP